MLIEIVDRQHLVVHHDVARAVDALLRDRAQRPESRYRDEQGKIVVEQSEALDQEENLRNSRGRNGDRNGKKAAKSQTIPFGEPPMSRLMRVYCYGVGQNRLRSAAQNLGVPVEITDDLHKAKIVITLKNYYRKRPQPIVEAEDRGIPVYVLRSNTVRQMEVLLADIFALQVSSVDALGLAIEETRQGMEKVLAGAPVIELSPQPPQVRRQQHRLAREAELISHSYGREPNRRVRLYRE